MQQNDYTICNSYSIVRVDRIVVTSQVLHRSFEMITTGERLRVNHFQSNDIQIPSIVVTELYVCICITGAKVEIQAMLLSGDGKTTYKN